MKRRHPADINELAYLMRLHPDVKLSDLLPFGEHLDSLEAMRAYHRSVTFQLTEAGLEELRHETGVK